MRLILRIGLLTALVILLFQATSLLVIYRYLRLDIYLCLVALLFLGIGWLLSRRRPKANPATLLSAKELQVLKLVAEGKTNKEIAALQYIEVSTVKTHVNNIYTKLSVSNRKEARTKYAEMAQAGTVL